MRSISWLLHDAASLGRNTALLTPTGSYSVGRTSFHWIDPNRIDPVAAQAGTKREFMVIVWYPAEANTSEVHALRMPERWALSEAKLLYAERSNSPNPLTMTEALRAVHESVSSSIAEAPPARTKNLWPLLLFSPGAGVNPAFYSEDLASHGYAVFRNCSNRMGRHNFPGWAQGPHFRQALRRWEMDCAASLGQRPANNLIENRRASSQRARPWQNRCLRSFVRRCSIDPGRTPGPAHQSGAQSGWLPFWCPIKNHTPEGVHGHQTRS